MLNLGAPELLILIALPVFGILPLRGILDAATRPDVAWQEIGNSRVAWILVQIFLGVFGAVAYFAAIRPNLKAAQSAAASGV